MGEAFSDKEVAFSLLPCNFIAGGGGCGFIKLSEWLNVKVKTQLDARDEAKKEWGMAGVLHIGK